MKYKNEKLKVYVNESEPMVVIAVLVIATVVGIIIGLGLIIRLILNYC